MVSRKSKRPDLAVVVLTLAGQHGWPAVTPTKLAKAAQISATDAAAYLGSPSQTMQALANYVSHTAAAQYHHDKRNSAREALFEILMLRFDVLQAHRAGFLELYKAARRHPRLAAAIAQAIYPQLASTLRSAHIEASSPWSRILALGLGAIYGGTLCIWRRDDSPDLAKTMSALDRYLRWAERLSHLLHRRQH